MISSADPISIDRLAIDVASRSTLADAAGTLANGLARLVRLPVALLSRNGGGWQFEAQGFPGEPGPQSLPAFPVPDPQLKGLLPAGSDDLWTGIPLGEAGAREWVVMVPGSMDRWRDDAALERFVEHFGASLKQAGALDDELYKARFARRLYRFSSRLVAERDLARLNTLILTTMARQVSARTAALAVFRPEDNALAIAATYGYPSALVEHVRLMPGEGIIGRVYSTRKAEMARAPEREQRRLRYRTDSYMVIPIVSNRRCLAVVALTDRSDSRAFDRRDFAAARMLATHAALALVREQAHETLTDLAKLATVDPVTGLFNRRYLETRLDAEVQRARRQQQDLALLMIDIDDFKRVNDTWGHLEGDRALHEVAELLRGGVRVFDVCARYGGEEFVIVMPGATEETARQIAERIRRGVFERFRLDPLTLTVSVGIGKLTAGASSEDLVASADRALITAKRTGKNLVCMDRG
jgi:diguanylate cyclase (GGDEF)-like protein